MILCVLKRILKKNKSIFMQLLESAILDHHLQEVGPSFRQPQKGHEKCIFETPHNKIKSVSEHKESLSKVKKIPKKVSQKTDCKGGGG